MGQNFEVSHCQLCGVDTRLLMSKSEKADANLNSLQPLVLVHS